MDLCDKCGVQAYVKTVIDTGLPLYWCARHYRLNEEALAPYVTHTTDLRHMLTKGAQ